MGVRRRMLPVGWYPGSAQACREEIADYIRKAPPLPPVQKVYGGIVPHAGWYFSGRLAAQVMHLASRVGQPQVVCVFGGHLGAGSPPLLVMEDGWETPLGVLEMATEFFDPLQAKLPCYPEPPGDNTIEVQLPLVKYFFPEARLLAVRAPHSRTAVALGQAVAEVARDLKQSLLVIGSTDLTHYGPNYGWAPKGYGTAAVKWVKEVNDRKFVQRVLALDADGVLQAGVQDQSACSSGGAAAAITASKAMGATTAHQVGYYTSYDVMPGDSFVGYVGVVYVS